jgi:hypothetical protein
LRLALAIPISSQEIRGDSPKVPPNWHRVMVNLNDLPLPIRNR